MSPSFNKEAFVDFIAAQIKTLSFLAYIIRIYQVSVVTFSQLSARFRQGVTYYSLVQIKLFHPEKENIIVLGVVSSYKEMQ